jgi:hypothetical protein
MQKPYSNVIKVNWTSARIKILHIIADSQNRILNFLDIKVLTRY